MRVEVLSHTYWWDTKHELCILWHSALPLPTSVCQPNSTPLLISLIPPLLHPPPPVRCFNVCLHTSFAFHVSACVTHADNTAPPAHKSTVSLMHDATSSYFKFIKTQEYLVANKEEVEALAESLQKMGLEVTMERASYYYSYDIINICFIKRKNMTDDLTKTPIVNMGIYILHPIIMETLEIFSDTKNLNFLFERKISFTAAVKKTNK